MYKDIFRKIKKSESLIDMSIFSETGQLILAYSGLSGLYSGMMRTTVTLHIQTKLGLLNSTLSLSALNLKQK